MSKIRIAVHGAAGRMGRRLVALASADPELVVAVACEHAQHPDLGQDAGTLAGVQPLGVALTPSILAPVDAVIDFSVPAAAAAITQACVAQSLPLVMATTGLGESQHTALREAAKRIPVLVSPSMSLAVNLTMKLAGIAGAAVKDNAQGVDVEIIERHHRYKEDAPSGTALRFGEIIASAMGQSQHTHGRHGQTGKRLQHEIGYHAVRVGDNPGEHTILFGFLGETIELTVRATNRDCYALGALAAAKFVARRPPGLYSISDVLGL